MPPIIQNMQSQLRCSPLLSICRNSEKYEYTIGTDPPILQENTGQQLSYNHIWITKNQDYKNELTKNIYIITCLSLYPLPSYILFYIISLPAVF